MARKQRFSELSHGEAHSVTEADGFGWRSALLWGLCLAGASLSRTAVDWLAPTTDFRVRSTASTILGVSILLTAAFSAAYRSGSFAAGTLTAMAASAIAAPIEVAGAALLLAVWHDPATMAAIRRSGGLAEVFALPFLTVLPAVVLGTIGGLLGGSCR